MTQDEQNQVLAYLQSIVSQAVEAQDALDHASQLPMLVDLLNEIEEDRMRAVRIVAVYSDDPTKHAYVESGFAESCRLCGESPSAHDG